MTKANLDFSNEYSRNARLKPALLVFTTLARGCWVRPEVFDHAWGALWTLAAAGFTYLLAHFDAGLLGVRSRWSSSKAGRETECYKIAPPRRVH